MTLNRRQWLAQTLRGTAGVWAGARLGASPSLRAQASQSEARIVDVVRAFGTQGFHRTGTAVDQASGEWLVEQVRAAGLSPTLESFMFSRIDPVTSAVVIGGRRLDGLPLFDASLTEADGVTGTFGLPGGAADVVLMDTAVNAANAGALGETRRQHRHKAIVVVTNGQRPGLCPSNADEFLKPYGPPVLQVSSDDAAFLTEQAAKGTTIQVIAHATRRPAPALNVTATLYGTDQAAAPIVVMTPRSGWYGCASERAGGIAAWLEVMRALKPLSLPRTVMFLASTGHELGHLGINAYLERRRGFVTQAQRFLHLGANIGGAVAPATNLQASGDDLDRSLTRHLEAEGLTITRRTPRGRVPSGEAEAIHRGNGAYVSITGGNAWFHNVGDIGPQVVDASVVARFGRAFAAFVRESATT